jgi:hypothetical protein
MTKIIDRSKTIRLLSPARVASPPVLIPPPLAHRVTRRTRAARR